MHRDVLEHRLLAPGSDLRGAFVKALAAHVEEGWQLETFFEITYGKSRNCCHEWGLSLVGKGATYSCKVNPPREAGSTGERET